MSKEKQFESGRIFKTLRFDNYCFWEKFTKELISPSLRKAELRYGDRKAFTLKLKDNGYVVAPTNKEIKRYLIGEGYNAKDKITYTRHQSTSYVNFSAGYVPPPFGWDKNRKDLLVGFSFPVETCIFKRIMMYDTGTAYRPYDFDTEENALAYLKKKIEDGEWHTSLESLQDHALSLGEVGLKKHNEVMAKLKYSDDVQVTVFTNNIESRLLAQVCMIDFRSKLRAKKNNPALELKVSIYPKFNIYDEDSQAVDIETAKNDEKLAHYCLIRAFLVGDISAFVDIYSSVKFDRGEFWMLIKKLNMKLFEEYNPKNHIDADFYTYFKDLFIAATKSISSFVTIASNLGFNRSKYITYFVDNMFLFGYDQFISSSQDLFTMLSVMDNANANEFVKDINRNKPEVMPKLSDFAWAINNFPEDKYKLFVNVFKDFLPSIIKNSSDLFFVFKQVSLEQRARLLAALLSIDFFGDKIFRTVNDFRVFLSYFLNFSNKNLFHDNDAKVIGNLVKLSKHYLAKRINLDYRSTFFNLDKKIVPTELSLLIALWLIYEAYASSPNASDSICAKVANLFLIKSSSISVISGIKSLVAVGGGLGYGLLNDGLNMLLEQYKFCMLDIESILDKILQRDDSACVMAL